MTYVSCLSVNVDSYSDLTTDNLNLAKCDVNSVENDRLVTMVTLITAVN